jgi:hypothetical protein
VSPLRLLVRVIQRAIDWLAGPPQRSCDKCGVRAENGQTLCLYHLSFDSEEDEQ